MKITLTISKTRTELSPVVLYKLKITFTSTSRKGHEIQSIRKRWDMIEIKDEVNYNKDVLNVSSLTISIH